jgi:heavy metal sensor kinase
MRYFPKSARARLAVTYSLTVMLLILAYSAALYYLYRQDVLSEFNKKLRSDVETMGMIVEQASAGPDPVEAISKTQAGSLDPANWLTEVWTTKGERIFSSGQIAEFPLGQTSTECSRTDWHAHDLVLQSSLNVRVLCVPSEALPDQYIIRVARLTETSNLQLRRFLSLMVFGAPTIILLAGFAGYGLARRTLSPIKKISDKAKIISAEKLSERLPVENPDDELGELAKTFNETFERLENSFNQMRRFTADASHELRTPLSAIRTLGEVALRQDQASHRETISGILEESARLQSLCESLLLLSKADAGAIPFKFQDVNLSSLVQDCVQLLEVLAEEKSQTIRSDLADELMIRADPHFLRQAIMNFIDNAIKYSPKGTEIVVHGFKNNGEVTLSFRDNGPGIAPEHQKRIFDRFYRIDTGRARTDGGAGLGLAICQWIISSHKGHIEIKSEVGIGTEFVLHFPT